MTVVPGTFLRVVSVALVGLTAWEAARGWLRYRDRYRADILWVVGLLAPILLLGDVVLDYAARGAAIGFVVNVLFLLQPFFLLRLVSRFREVPKALLWMTGAIAIAGGAAGALWNPGVRGGWTPIVCAYFAVQLTYAAHAFGRESQRASGVTGSRLWFASLGTWLHVVIALVLGAEALVPSMAEVGPGVRQMLGVGVFASYYAGLVAPRSLRAIWAQRELYRHIRETAARQPRDRVAEAAADLQRAVGHGVASVVRTVLLFDDTRPDILTTRATNTSTWARLEVRPGAGLLGRALSRGTPVVGLAGDFEPEVARLAMPLGRSVCAVPITSAGRRWGLLIVVERHGSLFPDDDLEFITVLCQHTAATLEHARLVTVERDHLERLAAVRLRDREARFGQILQSIADYAVLVLDDAGHVLEWKAGAEILFGYAAEQILAEAAAPLFSLDASGLEGMLANARQAGHVNESTPCRRRDGTEFIAHVTVRPLAPDAAGLTGFVVVVRDETERRAMGERLQQAQKMEAVGQLAGGVAHDFNNLLTGVLGYAAAIESHPGYDPVLGTHLADIRKVAERATSLTRRLLAFSRREVVQPKLVNLSDIVSELVPMLQRVMDERVRLTFSPASPSTWIVACPTQIEQVVLNLAVNARDAMPDGGRLLIRTDLVRLPAEQRAGDALLSAGDYAMLVVTDEGTGMEPAVQAHMFEPFFTTKEVGHGTGLGLSTIYGIVKQMHGGIDVESAPGQGTSFTIFLPAAPEPFVARAANVETVTSLDGTETVLLVEDDNPIRALVAVWLRRHGYRTLVARSVTDAIALAARTPRIDLIVTDVMMPGGNGPELVEALRRNDPALRAIYVSGYAHATLATEGHLPPGTHFVAKPFAENDLLARVRAVLDESAARPNRSGVS